MLNVTVLSNSCNRKELYVVVQYIMGASSIYNWSNALPALVQCSEPARRPNPRGNGAYPPWTAGKLHHTMQERRWNPYIKNLLHVWLFGAVPSPQSSRGSAHHRLSLGRRLNFSAAIYGLCRCIVGGIDIVYVEI